MNKRALALSTIVLLVVVNATMGSLALYPFSERDHRPVEDAFVVDEPDEYAVDARLAVDGETVVSVEATISDTEGRYTRHVSEEVVTESYQNATSDTIHTRSVFTGESAERRVRHLRDNPDRTVVSEEWEGETVTVVSVAREPGDELDPSGAASVVTRTLLLSTYDRVSSADEQGLRVLRPQNGWYNGSRSYRLTDVSGEVRFDPTTDVIHSADVEWTLADGTPTYAHYLLVRDDAVTQEISYEYRDHGIRVDTPDWVDDAATATRGGS
ncbi:hypothetical protein [Haloprofundus sp. MHR1]|uniref:hypothetical protein n=1 Tax=Haloprofundus sp. MHR1 TaxID=2572921 RepID=UPI0010BEFD28|nr:hypothetical protein [Haloprofundus sp. MHR1]QCJ46799.1 hypothetical protein FCF25_06605 [Haloprofundus sp. MHR1]